ncbi:Ubiquitin-like-conjugating enzyme ATG10 [Gryllus bimaculatus]|nr:Ubiquitin-like-conjugating enzyme ATG10 [Gryllus bimaculatus]
MFLHFRSSGVRAAKRAMMLKNGTLSYEEFCFFSKLFASVALKNNDTWIIHGSKEDLGSMYMVKKIAPHELHEPHLCLRGLSFHQQHREPSHVETIRDIIRSCVKLLNDRVGTPPQRSISMMELSCSQVNTKRILWHRRSLSLPDPKKPFESEPPEPFSIYPKWCGSHDLLQSCSESDGECSHNLGSKSAILSNRENSFRSNMLPLNTLSQGVTSNVIISDCVESEDIIGPPTQFCNTVKSLKNESDENYFLDDDVFNLQEADTSFYKTIEKIDNTLFENELHSPTMPSSTEEKLLFSMDSSDDLFFSNTGTSSRKKPVNAPCGMEPCLLYCDSFTREDPAALNVPENEEKTMFWEFHVLYSVSYCVPVLFFQMGKWCLYRSSGELLTLNSKEDYEHPLLRRPFYFLHPCGTESLLKILKPSWNPLVSWLMTIGPSIGLNICPLYGQSRDEPEPQTILKNKEAVI